jgi:iron complex outermembrane receptor protein
MLSALGVYQGINRGWTQVASARLDLGKTLSRLASDRHVVIAAGYEYRAEYGGYIPNPTQRAFLDSDFSAPVTQGSFHVNEGYARIELPLLGGRPFAEDLTLEGAARLSRYSSSGTLWNYQAGARWSPVRDLALRANLASGFRAPSVTDLYGGLQPHPQSAVDPCASFFWPPPLKAQCAPVPMYVCNGTCETIPNITTGGSNTLKPELAWTATAGFVFEPRWLRGLRATVDYWRISVTRGIGDMTAQKILDDCYPAYVGSSAAPDPAACARIRRSPTDGQLVSIDDSLANGGSVTTSGVDVGAHFATITSLGRFGLALDAVWLIEWRATLASGAPIAALATYDLGALSATGGVTPRLRFNAAATYGLGGLDAGLRARFIGGFRECADALFGGISSTQGSCSSPQLDPFGAPYPYHSVPAYVSFDLALSYALRTAYGTMTIAAGVQNLLDANPPPVYDSFVTFADPTYDYAGRFVYGRISQQF